MPLDCMVCETATAGEGRTSGDRPTCPLCGGGLIPLNVAWRCGRCGFALCAGCEPLSGLRGAEIKGYCAGADQ